MKDKNYSNGINYPIDPGNNKISKAKFSVDGIRGLLSKYDIIIKKW